MGNWLNFIFLGAIFASLAVIVVIFSKRAKRIKELGIKIKASGGKIDHRKIAQSCGSFLEKVGNFFIRMFFFFKKAFLFLVRKILTKIKKKDSLAQIEIESKKEENEEDFFDSKKSEGDESVFSVNNEEKESFSKDDLIDEVSHKNEHIKKVERFFSDKKNLDSNSRLTDLVDEDEAEQEIPKVALDNNEGSDFEKDEFSDENLEFSRKELIEDSGWFGKIFVFIKSKFSKENKSDLEKKEGLLYSSESLKEESADPDGYFSQENETENDSSASVKKIDGNFNDGEENKGLFEELSNDNVVKEPEIFSKNVKMEDDEDEQLGVDRKILEKKIIQKIAKDPRNKEHYRNLGELYIKMKNFDDAESSYRHILKISPRDADAKRKIEKVRLLRRLG